MRGPYETGATASPVPASSDSWEQRHGLLRGRDYRVAKAFVDADGDTHSIGEQWSFVCGMFSKFDNEITICARRRDGGDWKIPLVWDRESQQDIIENIEAYIVLA